MRFIHAINLTLSVLAASASAAEVQNSADPSLQIYAVEMLQGAEQSVAGAGIYLGKGLVATAAHVAGPNHPKVRIGGADVSAKMIKRGSFDKIDLALFSIEGSKLPENYRTLSLPLCQTPAQVDAKIILVAPQGSTGARIISPLVLSPLDRSRWSTMISDVETSGKSGSGVFDADKKCLLGILSAKITDNTAHKDIGTFFVPASTIQAFTPVGYRW